MSTNPKSKPGKDAVRRASARDRFNPTPPKGPRALRSTHGSSKGGRR
jgi:hypothetical protein